MSGLYLLVVVGIWAGLTSLLIKGWRRWRVRTEVRKWTVDVLCLVIALLWIGASFWYGGGRRIYYDTLVNRMCREDGGIKVYETVKLPAGKFDQWGMVKSYDPTQGENALGSDFVFRRDIHYFKKEPPTFIRYHYQLFRRSDVKLLGESISYGRGGGDLPGPWEPSTFDCPPTSESSEIALFKKILIPSN